VSAAGLMAVSDRGATLVSRRVKSMGNSKMRYGVRFIFAALALLCGVCMADISPAAAQSCTTVSQQQTQVPGQGFVVTTVTNCNGETITTTFSPTNFNGYSGTASGPYGNGSFNYNATTQQLPNVGNLSAESTHITGTIFGGAVDCTISYTYAQSPTGVPANLTVTGTSGSNCNAFLALQGVGSTTSTVASNKVSASGRLQRVVTHDILSSPLATENELADQAEQQKSENAKSGTPPRIRTFLADVTVESDTISGSHATIGGVTLGTTIDFDNHFTIGAMIPLDYMSLPVGNATRVGVVGFSQYNWHPENNKALSIKPTVFLSYIDTIGSSGGPDFSTFGVGTGLSATYDPGGKFIPGAMTYFSYSKDSTTGPGNYQSLFAIGPKMGFRPSSNWVVDLGLMWNKDVSKYLPAGTKDYYFDLTAGISYRISRTFKLDIGYDKVLGINNFRSDEFSIGGRFTF
jgi:hypothetical protein